MGLDMYLYADKYVSRKDFSNYNYNSDSEPPTNPAFDQIVSSLNAQNLIDKEWSGITVSLPIGYWRKANAIHAWIVNNCADGVDECQRIQMSHEDAQRLVDICKEVIANPSRADELLPPQSGFFFGSTEIDEWYLHDLKRTIDIFEKLLHAKELFGITYQASW